MDRFLLYVDILGFSDLVQSKKHLLPDIFRVLDKSNAHDHGDFSVIQFSDTIIVYNVTEAKTPDGCRYIAMYLSEFAQELQLTLLGRDIFFRGLITYGEFEDSASDPNASYSHIRAFWGDSLVKAYRLEKTIQAIGLFVDATVLSHMHIYPTIEYDRTAQLWFVDTLQMLQGSFLESGDYTYVREDLIATGNQPLMAYELQYLKLLHTHGHDLSLAPSIRAKYLATWEIYRSIYPRFCADLEAANFQFEKIIKLDWTPFLSKIGTSKGFHG